LLDRLGRELVPEPGCIVVHVPSIAAPDHTASGLASRDFTHAWLDRGGSGGDLMELNGWSSLRRCCAVTVPQRPQPGPAAPTTALWKGAMTRCCPQVGRDPGLGTLT
jgi:hypothetical protein